MNILYAYADSPREWNSSEWRVRMPVDAINWYAQKTGEQYSARSVHIKELADYMTHGSENVAWADIVIVQRLLIEPIIQSCIRCKKEGKTVIVDYDDAYHIMPQTVQSYNFWQHGAPYGMDKTARIYPKPIDQITMYSKLVDAVTAPSGTLVNDWRKIVGDNAYLVPNYLETWRYSLKPHAQWRIRVGWGGSHSHFHSFVKTGFGHSLEKLVRRYDHVDVVIAGTTQMADKIKVPKNRMIYLPWGKFDLWLTYLQQIDIGAIPLTTEYDRRRSWIKPMEFALTGIPFIASSMVDPIAKTFDSAIVKENNMNSWYSILSDMVERYDHWYSAAIKTRELALEADIRKNIKSVLELYERIHNNANSNISS